MFLLPRFFTYCILYLASAGTSYTAGAAGWKISTAFIKISVIALHMRSPYDERSDDRHSPFEIFREKHSSAGWPHLTLAGATYFTHNQIAGGAYFAHRDAVTCVFGT